ncbi:MAG TPA: lipopolysaccharide biosynthesis protein, partial [Gemmatimonadales bacterium]|nr:lipopolysaccharide biosynthesis protein [Gemmatimonadales bacterium]
MAWTPAEAAADAPDPIAAKAEAQRPFAPADRAQLDRSLAHGIAWTAGVKWTSQVLSWASTLIVARLLIPEDYALVNMATVYLGLVQLLNEFGLGSAVIQHHDLTDDQVAQVSGMCVLFGLGAFALSCLAAVPLARFYDAPALTWVVIVMSVNFIITGFRTVPISLMQRDLQFRVLAYNDGMQALILSVAMVVFAALGLRYWTLVIGAVLSSLLSTLFAYVQRPHGVRWPRVREIRKAMTFGGHVVVSRVAWYTYQNADFVVAGKMLGKAALGAYSFGWSLASIPIQKVNATVGRVTGSIFAAVQEDHAAVRRYLTLITEGLALLTLPASIGMGLVAPEFVALALGPKWAEAVAPLQLLALYAAYRSIVTPLPQVVLAVGLSKEGAKISAMSAVVLPIAFVVGSRWGPAGIAAAWIIVYPIVTLPLYVLVFRRIGMTVREYAGALWPAVSSVLIMAAGVWLVRGAVPARWPLAARFALPVATGALLYPGALLVLHRERVRTVRA